VLTQKSQHLGGVERLGVEAFIDVGRVGVTVRPPQDDRAIGADDELW
jgi:hypothetical protein